MPPTLKPLENKFIIVDTNVLIDSAKFSEEFKELYDILNSLNTNSVLSHVVHLEFLRGASSLAELRILESFLRAFYGTTRDPMELPLTKEIFKISKNIALIANRANNSKIMLADCIIGAFLAQFSDRLFLVTQNHHDFPPCLYEVLHIQNIRLENGKIKSVGVYRFLKDNYIQYSKDLLGDSEPFVVRKGEWA